MAQITLGPLSIGGIQAPLNLLGGLLTTNNPTNLLYPLDLASNPIYGHAVQFTIFEYISPLSQATKSAVNSLSPFFNQTATNIANAVNNPSFSSVTDIFSNSGISNVLNKQVLNKQTAISTATLFSQLASRQAYTTEQSTPLATISLYMPDNLTTSFESNYNGMSMTDILGPAGYLSNAISDIMKSGNQNAQKVLGPYSNSITIDALSRLSNKFGVQGENLKGVLQQAIGQIPNPQMQMIYKGINLRSFQLQFIFTPTSPQEAQQVDQIVNAFSYYSVPELNKSDNSGQFLTPPQIFKIKFAFTGNSGIIGSIGNVFKNTLTNVLGSQLSTALFGSNASSTIAAAPSAKIFSVGDCVLNNVTVDYAPNGWAAFNDGYPVQTTLSLQFTEMDIVTKDKITSWTGYSGPTKSSPNYGTVDKQNISQSGGFSNVENLPGV